MNLVCQDDKLREKVLANLRLSFRSITYSKLDEDVNEVVYGSDDPAFEGLEAWKSNFDIAGKNLNCLTKDYKISTDDVVDVADLLRKLTL